MTAEFVVAVHAVVFLYHKGKSMNSEEIAENVCTNPARIRKVMAKLKRAGLIQTKEGSANGGYTYLSDPDKTTLLDILNAVETNVVASSWKSGNSDMECLIASGMADIMDGIFGQMEQRCKDVLESITINDIDHKIFKKRDVYDG